MGHVTWQLPEGRGRGRTCLSGSEPAMDGGHHNLLRRRTCHPLSIRYDEHVLDRLAASAANRPGMNTSGSAARLAD